MSMLFSLFIATQLIFTSDAQECDAPVKTLTTSCNNSCGAYEPCLVYNSTECSNSGSHGDNCNNLDGCSYSCFPVFGAYNSDPTQFVFLIPYQEVSSNGIYAAANNDLVIAIDQLTLSPQTTKVLIQGGDYQQINKGDVVELELAHNLLTSQSQVISVSLMAINLSTRIYDVPDMIPSSIVSLSLANTLLTEFPVHLTSLSNVVTLHLNDNYITTVNSSVSWEKLVVLDLYQNNIATFEGNFPGLTELYLNGNNLTEIPVIIYTLKHLTTLAIQNNPLESRSFTEAQIIFLQTLIRLDLVNSDFQNAVNCSLPEQRTIGNNIVVCVSDFSPQSDSLDSLSPASGVPVSSISYSSGSTSVDNDHSNSGAGRTSFPLIAVVVTAIVVFIALSSTAIYYWKQHNGEKTRMVYNNVNRRPSKHQATVLDGNQHLPEVNCDDIEDIRVIGRGAFTTVWLIRYQNSVLLASKRLREDADSERTQAFMEEIKLMSKLDHPNIVAFVGAAWTTKSNFQALFEFVENGDLHSYLAPSLPRYWTRAKLQLAVDVVEALVYIHAFTPSLVHQNLNSHNVLITTDMQAKLIDVGVPWFPPTPTQITMRTRTASRWLAPEIISGSSEYNHSADIFAFGVLLSEFDTHELPYENATSVNGSRHEEMTILRRVANTTLRPAFSDTCPPIILELAKQCMVHEPRNRPPALKIAYALRTLQREAFNM